MEVGVVQSLLSTAGEVVFNVLDGDGDAESLAGLGNVVAPQGLPDGNGYHITFVGGNEGAAIRNPVTNRPHSHGAIVHRFRRAAPVISIEGMIISSDTDYEVILTDQLFAVHDQMLQAGVFGQPNEAVGRYFWDPPGQDVRFRNVRVYDPLRVEPSAPGSSGPKTFAFSLIAEHPEALTYSQDDTTVAAGGSASVPNDGNTATWPVFRVYGVTTDGFVLDNGTHRIRWGQGRDPTAPFILGDYIEIDCFRQTMYWDGDQANALRFLDMRASDFFSIPVGGATVSIVGAGPVTVLSNDAWVG